MPYKNIEDRRAKRQIWMEKNKESQLEYHRIYNKKWYQKNKEEHDRRGRIWGENPENKKRRVEYVQKYVAKNMEKVKKYRKGFEQSVGGKYRLLTWRAKHFSGTPLTQEQFALLITQPCAYCGDKGKVGIDRVDNLQGYTSENSAPCCKTCNFMKKTMTKKQFLEQIKKIYTFNN